MTRAVKQVVRQRTDRVAVTYERWIESNEVLYHSFRGGLVRISSPLSYPLRCQSVKDGWILIELGDVADRNLPKRPI